MNHRDSRPILNVLNRIPFEDVPGQSCYARPHAGGALGQCLPWHGGLINVVVRAGSKTCPSDLVATVS
jgi:hypothetical protein